ncbi:MAG: Stp1/IreP family PP2C-type Ser/Thr phosphatase [Candidatus Aminicenantales bacterium]
MDMDEKESYEIRVGFGSDKGRVRSANEDRYSVFIPYPGSEKESEFRAVLGVADGMGGHKAGDLASQMITDRLNAAFIQGGYTSWFDRMDDLTLIMKNIVREINRELYTLSKRDNTLGEMGSTLTFGIIKDSILHLIHVGDSRCYCLRNGEMIQLTRDHSWVADQVSSGVLSKEEAVGHPRNNILTQAIGFDPNIEPQVIKWKVQMDDWYLFCSDGLSNPVGEKEILEVLTANVNPQRACDALINLANQKGGEDNITAVIAHLGKALKPTSQVGPEEENPARRRKIKIPRMALAGFLGVVLLAFFFFLGITYQKHRINVTVQTLLVESENYAEAGDFEKSVLLAESILRLDPKNKQAQALVDHYKPKISIK